VAEEAQGWGCAAGVCATDAYRLRYALVFNIYFFNSFLSPVTRSFSYFYSTTTLLLQNFGLTKWVMSDV
jgi:hypothetical protein